MENYEKIGWIDSPATDTPINADNLNHMDEGIYVAFSKAEDASIVGYSDAEVITDAIGGKALGFKVYGKCYYEPGHASPSEINAWNGVVTTSNGSESSIADLKIRLLGIKVDDIGNYVDADGQNWLVEKADFLAGTIERKIGLVELDSAWDWQMQDEAFVVSNFRQAYNVAASVKCNKLKIATGFYDFETDYLLVTNDLIVKVASVNSLAEFKQWLDSENVCFLYTLMNQFTEEISSESKKALSELNVYAESTTVNYGQYPPFGSIGYAVKTTSGILINELFESKVTANPGAKQSDPALTSLGIGSGNYRIPTGGSGGGDDLIGTSSTSPITDSADGNIRTFEAYGKCEQGENPSPDNPQEIKAWDGKITTRNSDGTLQSVADIGISLYGIKVTSGGNYTDKDGQQWLCDKIDLEKGVIVRSLAKEAMKSSYSWTESNSYAGDYVIRNWATDRGIRNSHKHLQTHFRTQSVPASFAVGDAYIGSDINFWIGTDVCPDVASWKSWLDSHDLSIIYAMASSVEEPLTSEQINALRVLKTFSDGTTVEYGELEPFSEIGYWLNNKNAQSVADVDAKIPFRFGITADGQYGYYKAGADSVTPFSSGGSSKPTYLIVNQGNGINVLDFSSFEEKYYTNSELMSGIVQITPWFHVVFNTIQRNCLTLVADDKLSVHWRRSASYAKEDFELSSGENHLLWGAAEGSGYAVVICGEDE